MTAAILRGALVALASMSVAAYGQSIVATAPSTGGPLHADAAIPGAMGIVAGAPVQLGRPVHPGTAILDSMGIFAGLPAPDAPNGAK
jgi:hypothetical protein